MTAGSAAGDVEAGAEDDPDGTAGSPGVVDAARERPGDAAADPDRAGSETDDPAALGGVDAHAVVRTTAARGARTAATLRTALDT
jgi:hypothetical protein